jgi:prepilin-type N-terminal cleavage/methylation domain-containing protein
MRWPARLRDDEGGFTLIELLIGMGIIGILIGAIGSALVVSLRTTDVTNKRMSENHDVQIASSYLANDVQSASGGVAQPPTSANCSGPGTRIVGFNYASSGDNWACYYYRVSGGETQVARSYNGQTVVVAHFAAAGAPTVSVTYDPSRPTIPVSVTMTFSKAADCTLDCTYTLFGSRRSFNPASAGSGTTSTGDTTLLSTGASSPLWVQGSCPDPGTSSACIVDTTKTALPISDVQTTNWSVAPLWSKLNDGDTTTSVANAPGSKSEARVLLAAVDPPDPGVNPTVEFHAAKVAGSSPRVTLTLYDGSTSLATSGQFGPINQSKNYDWTLTTAQTSAIPAASYAHLRLGFSVSNASGTDTVAVDGVALDTLDVSAVGLLTIKGALYVNSQLSSAVRLTGTKTATKISITNGGNFLIWSPGACAGCNHNTVSCAACTWVGNQPWTSYTNSIPDPLRSLPAPDPATLPQRTSCNGGGVCPPGKYPSFSPTSNVTLTDDSGQPGIYYLQNGMSVTGSTVLTCAAPCTGGVMLYIAAGSVTFAGSSSVNLPGATSGIYKNIVMFQARTDTNEVKFAGNSGSGTTNVLGGVVYVPMSNQVTLATGSASLTAKAIVAQNIKVSSAVAIG